MNLDNAFGIHEQALKLRARRSEVLAANLANADTPGYKARDFDFQKMLSKEVTPAVRMSATHAGHIKSDSNVVPNMNMQYRNPQQPSLDGNTVEVEREQVEFGTNTIQYQASLRFLEGRIKSLKTAIRGSVQ